MALVALLSTAASCSGEAPEPEGFDLPEAEIERLEQLGYLPATEGAGDRSGVTVHDRGRASPGVNFYVSGHGPEAVLMDMDGNVLHRWAYDFRTLRARRQAEGALPAPGLDQTYWRRAHLLPNGDILAIHTHYALIELDRNSQLLWEYPGRAHHDLEVTDDGRIHLLVNERRVLPRLDPDGTAIEDFVVTLDADGREIRRVSLLESVERAGLGELLARMPRQGDLFHTNSLRVLDGRFADRLPALARGNVLVSFLTLNTIAVVDLDAKKVVWTLTGDFRFQHDPTLLANGRLLLFDNLGPAMQGVPLPLQPGALRRLWQRTLFSRDLPAAPASAVLEIEPASGKVVWSYRGTDEHPFSSESSGAAQRLENGNTLIVESQFGRAFEVTPAGETVWEFVSPHRVGSKVAQLFDLERLGPDFPIDWADGVSPAAAGGAGEAP